MKNENKTKTYNKIGNTNIDNIKQIPVTRKNVKKEVDILKHKSIQEVKDYLRKHNLTKIGSSAPDHILRTTFENAYLSGNVSNNNPDILLHNWHKEEEI